MKVLSFLFLILSLKSYAQDSNPSFTELRPGTYEPFSLPITVNDKGEWRISDNTENLFSFGPLGLFALVKSRSQYILPIRQDSFSFAEQNKDLSWVEIKRNRIEIGLGLEALIANNVISLGFLPYKGAYQNLIRVKKSHTDKIGPTKLPTSLLEMSSWEVGDEGRYQTYGGIQASVAVGVSLISIAEFNFTMQNKFVIGIKKIASDLITLTIEEDNLKKRQILSRTVVAKASFSKNTGKLFSSRFVLNLSNPDHERLFDLAVNGRLAEVQNELNVTSQEITWKGSEKRLYTGIPVLLGRSVLVGHFDISQNGMDDELDLNLTQSNGALIPLRLHKRAVYQSDKEITLFWSSEMNRTHSRALVKNFISFGRILGIEGFDSDVPDVPTFGSTVTHFGLSFSRDETELMKSINLDDLSLNLKERCLQESLKCGRKSVLNKVLKDFSLALKKPWSELRHDLGKLLGQRPALIYAVVKSMKFDKKVYFKFLSEKYQSVQGVGTIGL